MKEKLEHLIDKALESLDIERGFVLEHPNDPQFGDYTTNAGIVSGKKDDVLEYLTKHKPDEVDRIELAGPGFVNFYLSKEFFAERVKEICDKGEGFGKNEKLKGEKVMVEHTDPNYFKELHIGHYMPMTIGSTLAHLLEWNGAEVKEACYYSDVGLQAAKAVWAMKQGVTENPYVAGTKAYDEDENARREIVEINKKIYEKSDPEINKLYEAGSKQSVDGFNEIYRRFGVTFELYFYESESAKVGGKVVRENVGSIFEESEGAIVFHAEKYDPSLHTRVFINSEGISTYEAKDLGLAKLKEEKYPYTKSVIVTGNEQKEYFRVLLSAMAQVFPDLASKTQHVSHGMLRLPTGKMSSRTGDVITAEELIEDVKEKTQGKEEVAIAAIKYMILRQSIGNDIIFDMEKSVSTEGDSGVYLQYAHARACSILEKGKEQKSEFKSESEPRLVEKLLYRFPEVVERACAEYAPNILTTYLIELAAAFNNFYAHEQVIEDTPEAAYRLAIVEAFRHVMKNGLMILGIPAPERV